ncbi:alpha/beta hydrolase [Paludisphaera mucosa]|uniref:Alpha/beta fold hydrolase n=1 Tax=Paludisphaera mucosa TaxID=3030827 RepID=A0ABT6FFL2_9BACT|nr:alpha/beta fold hydrolase [Paludisphaera mucosa]MDG3006281.1 alpha/beta fold hydrolase [Paludisphaera mucosa]
MLRLLPILLISTTAWAGEPKDDARRFLDLCKALKFEEAHAAFGPKMAAALSTEKLKAVWTGIEKQLGPVTAMGEPREDRVGASRRVRIRCEFKTTPLDALVSFDPEGKIEGFFLTPAAADPKAPAVKKPDPPYVDPAKYTEEDVVVGAEGWPLAATLTRPKGVDKAPLVILVHGSGPHDRDETIGPNAPFRDLAHGLAGRGVAVLRYEKRTHAHKARYADPKILGSVGVQDEVVDDALAAAAKARGWKGIDPARIFVMGHSLGGTSAPLIARQDGKLAGIVLLAASARPSADLVREQIEHIRKVDPERAKGLVEIDTKLDEVLARMKAGTAKDDEKALGAPVRYWKSMDALQPAKLLAELPNLPVLVLQGGRDYQVTEADLDLLRKALNGRSNATVRLYPDLNHGFLKGEGKATPAEYEKPGFVDVRVIDDVARWVGTLPVL